MSSYEMWVTIIKRVVLAKSGHWKKFLNFIWMILLKKYGRLHAFETWKKKFGHPSIGFWNTTEGPSPLVPVEWTMVLAFPSNIEFKSLYPVQNPPFQPIVAIFESPAHTSSPVSVFSIIKYFREILQKYFFLSHLHKRL